MAMDVPARMTGKIGRSNAATCIHFESYVVWNVWSAKTESYTSRIKTVSQLIILRLSRVGLILYDRN